MKNRKLIRFWRTKCSVVNKPTKVKRVVSLRKRMKVFKRLVRRHAKVMKHISSPFLRQRMGIGLIGESVEIIDAIVGFYGDLSRVRSKVPDTIHTPLLLTHWWLFKMFGDLRDCGVLERYPWLLAEHKWKLLLQDVWKRDELGWDITKLFYGTRLVREEEEIHELKQDKMFNWRFFEKKWDFQFNRWKKAIILQQLLWKLRGYRRLSKTMFFIETLRTYYKEIMRMHPDDVGHMWSDWRSNNVRYWDRSPQSWKTMFSLRLGSLLVDFGITTNPHLTDLLLSYKTIMVDGLIASNKNRILYVGEIVQMNLMSEYTKAGIFDWFGSLYQTVSSYLKLDEAPYLYNDNSLNAFTLLRWPYEHEIERLSQDRWSDRWFRFEINRQTTKPANYRSSSGQKVKIYSRLTTKAKVVARLARQAAATGGGNEES